MSCTACKARLPVEADICPECGYPASGLAVAASDSAIEPGNGATKEYRLIQLLGAVVAAVGVAAVLVDSPIAAGVAITIGIGTYIIGLLGTWWNTGD